MKKISFISLALVFIGLIPLHGQIYYTKTGVVNFEASSPLEKIEAVAKSANCVLNAESGAVEMAVLIKSFNFDKALMQEHFNENYLESTKFPKAIFKGTISNIKEVQFLKDGKYKGNFEGKITIHGVTKSVDNVVNFRVSGGKITADTDFNLTVGDFDISIPSLVSDKVAKTAKVTIQVELQELKKSQ